MQKNRREKLVVISCSCVRNRNTNKRRKILETKDFTCNLI